jgi:hypothetical protein
VAPSIPVNDIRVACLEMGARTTDSSSGVIDLSRESHSLASRVVLSPETVAFSYCLPWDPATQGFLTFGAARPERAGRGVTYAKLQRNAARPNLYFVKLVGVSIGGIDLPVAPASIAADALVEVHTTFTYLKPDVYAVLRSNFRWWMKEYVVAPSSGELDTCYDFTHLNAIEVPIITLRFEGGASLELGIEQMMYLPQHLLRGVPRFRSGAGVRTGCCGYRVTGAVGDGGGLRRAGRQAWARPQSLLIHPTDQAPLHACLFKMGY